ncbi:MAG: M15 family metallopeptidase [Bacteroidota bacterium]
MRLLLVLACLFLLNCTDNKTAPENAEKPKTEIESTTAVPADSIKDEPAAIAQEKPLPPDFDTTIWEEVVRLDPSILLDLRYATENNFVDEKMYDCGRCFLRPDVARAVVEAHRFLQTKGYGFKMYDCYRPRPIQWKLWNKVPDPRYVADPRKGSMHNRGAAVDLTIVDSLGNELDMGTDFDYFGEEAYHSYNDHSDEIANNRALLLETMKKYNFRSTRTEWWHYSYKPKKYGLADWLWACKGS